MPPIGPISINARIDSAALIPLNINGTVGGNPNENRNVSSAPSATPTAVTAVGVALGALLTFLFSLGFPPTVPLIFNGMSAALSILALMLIGPMGGMVSILYAVRIEPLRALRLQ